MTRRLILAIFVVAIAALLATTMCQPASAAGLPTSTMLSLTARPTNTPIHDDGRWVWPWEYQLFVPVVMAPGTSGEVRAQGYP